jgi:pSer/pThr/pTyr-binding forkhead associated (FHA) protein
MSRNTTKNEDTPQWFLETTLDGGKSVERIPIQTLPFRVGRLEDLELTLTTQSISKHHAEITFEEGGLKVRDLSSTNGMFVNRGRVTEAPL